MYKRRWKWKTLCQITQMKCTHTVQPHTRTNDYCIPSTISTHWRAHKIYNKKRLANSFERWFSLIRRIFFHSTCCWFFIISLSLALLLSCSINFFLGYCLPYSGILWMILLMHLNRFEYSLFEYELFRWFLCYMDCKTVKTGLSLSHQPMLTQFFSLSLFAFCCWFFCSSCMHFTVCVWLLLERSTTVVQSVSQLHITTLFSHINRQWSDFWKPIKNHWQMTLCVSHFCLENRRSLCWRMPSQAEPNTTKWK